MKNRQAMCMQQQDLCQCVSHNDGDEINSNIYIFDKCGWKCYMVVVLDVSTSTML